MRREWRVDQRFPKARNSCCDYSEKILYFERSWINQERPTRLTHMIEKHRLAALSWGLAILLGGCTVLSVKEPNWPEKAPAQAYFEQVYDEDPKNQSMQTRQEYLNWVRQFYVGSDLYPFGWLELERGLLAETQTHLRGHTADRLSRLGQRISADWARDNRVHNITNTMLLVWSQVIQEAAATGEHLAAIDVIETDVAALLDQRLPGDSISAERYSRWIPEVL